LRLRTRRCKLERRRKPMFGELATWWLLPHVGARKSHIRKLRVDLSGDRGTGAEREGLLQRALGEFRPVAEQIGVSDLAEERDPRRVAALQGQRLGEQRECIAHS